MVNWYVSSLLGSDSNGGQTQTTPFATLSKAGSVVGAGDTVWVMRGQYTGVTLAASGASGSYITYRQWGGEQAQIVNSNLVISGSYVVVQGLQFTGVGLSIQSCNHVKVLDNTISMYSSGTGVLVYESDYIQLLNNQIGYNQLGVVINPLASDSSTGYKIVLERNVIEGNLQTGLYFTGSSYTGRSLVAVNNIGGNGSYGIQLGQSHVDIIYNTIANNAGGQISSTGVSDVFIKHNIMSGIPVTTSIGSTITYDYNIYQGSGIDVVGPNDLTQGKTPPFEVNYSLYDIDAWWDNPTQIITGTNPLVG